MTDFKNNHYTPKGLLKNFKCPTAGKLFYFDKRSPTAPVVHRNTDKIFSENYFYAIESQVGKRDTSVESNYFAPLDDTLAKLAEKIVNCARKKMTPNFSGEEKSNWGECLSKLEVRGPEFRDNTLTKEWYAKENANAYLRFENKFGAKPNPFQKIIIDETYRNERERKNALIRSLTDDLPMTLAALRERGVHVAIVTDSNSSFLIGSRPIVRFPLAFGSIDPQTQLWLPIAHDVAVCTGGPRDEDSLSNPSAAFIKRLNDQSFAQSTEIAGCSKMMIEGYAEAFKIMES